VLHSFTAANEGFGLCCTVSQGIPAFCRGRVRRRRRAGGALTGKRETLGGAGHGVHGFQQDTDDGGQGCVALGGPHTGAQVEILVDDDGDISLFHGVDLAAEALEEFAEPGAEAGTEALVLLWPFAGRESAKLRTVCGEWNEGDAGGWMQGGIDRWRNGCGGFPGPKIRTRGTHLQWGGLSLWGRGRPST